MGRLSWVILVGLMQSLGSFKREADQRVEGDETTEAEIRVMPFEDGGRDHKPRNTGGQLEAEEGEEMGSSLEPQGGTSPLTT